MKRFLSFMVLATLAGLVYVYTEVEAVKIGYTIRQEEQTKSEWLDQARVLKYNIDCLKAPRDLEKRLLARRIELKSPRSWQTLVLSQNLPQNHTVNPEWMAGTHIFDKFFVGTARAEAKESTR